MTSYSIHTKLTQHPSNISDSKVASGTLTCHTTRCWTSFATKSQAIVCVATMHLVFHKVIFVMTETVSQVCFQNGQISWTLHSEYIIYCRHHSGKQLTTIQASTHQFFFVIVPSSWRALPSHPEHSHWLFISPFPLTPCRMTDSCDPVHKRV